MSNFYNCTGSEISKNLRNNFNINFSPTVKRSELTKLSDNIKSLSSEINLHTKRISMQNSDNLKGIISNLLDRDAELLALNTKKSIIHELDFLKKTPAKTMSSLSSPIKKKLAISPQKKSSFNLNTRFSSDKLNNQKMNKKGNIKKVDFLNIEKSPTILYSREFTEESSSSELDKDLMGFGYSNTKIIKKQRIKSMENNPKKLNLYQKNLFHQQKKDLEIEMLRNKIKNDQSINFKDKPELSEQTQKIIIEKFKHNQPLYKRLNEVVEDKNVYLHKLKKFHNEESKKMKRKDFNFIYDNLNVNDITHYDHFDSLNFSRMQMSNSVKHNNNYNNKFIYFNRSPTSRNNTFFKMLNDTNFEIINTASNNILYTPHISPRNQHLNNGDNTIINENKEHFQKDGNPKNGIINNMAYLESVNRRYNKKNTLSQKMNTKSKNFDEDNSEKFEIQYPQRTLNWIKNEENWQNKKNIKIANMQKAKDFLEFQQLETLFKPHIDQNSRKILSAQKKISRNILYNKFNTFNMDNNQMTEDEKFHESIIFPSRRVFDNLYNRRFDSDIKREKILKEISHDFKPQINNDYIYKQQNLAHHVQKKKIQKSLNIPKNPKKHEKNFVKKLNNSKKRDLGFPEKEYIVKNESKETRKMRHISIKDNTYKIIQDKKEQTMKLLDEVEKENVKKEKINNINQQRRLSKSDQLYKLNIRSCSAWDKNKENNVYYDRKFYAILTKGGTINY